MCGQESYIGFYRDDQEKGEEGWREGVEEVDVGTEVVDEALRGIRGPCVINLN